MTNWDDRFLQLARHIGGWSKDPRRKVGAVIVDAKRRLVSAGYNGLPRGVADDPVILEDRETKLRTVIHAEQNALMFAGRDPAGCAVYIWPYPPCAACSSLLIQAGIVRVVSPLPTNEESRWWGEFALGRALLEQAGVTVDQWPLA